MNAALPLVSVSSTAPPLLPAVFPDALCLFHRSRALTPVTFGGDLVSYRPFVSPSLLPSPFSLCLFLVAFRLSLHSVSLVFVPVVILFLRVPAKLIVSPLSGNLYVNRLESVESHAYV